MAEISYRIPGEEDAVLKRKARLQGVRMRTLYGPGASYQGAFIDAEEEHGSRHTFAATRPLNEVWEATVFEHVSFFSLKSNSRSKRKSHSAGRESVSLRIGMNPSMAFRPWFTLTPYANFGGADGEGMGVAAGISNTWQNGANLSGEIFGWRPWDEGYYTIIEDGRKHGTDLSLTLPFTKKLILGSRAYYEELRLGGDAKHGSQNAGHRYAINTKVYYRLLHREGAYMGYGFRDDNLWNEYLIGSELGIFMQLDFQRYHRSSKLKREVINPEPKIFAQEIGLSLKHAISPHLGLTTEGFVGRDTVRNLQFGKLAGINGRLVLVKNPHLRMWVGASYVKYSSALESSGGKEKIASLGINCAF